MLGHTSGKKPPGDEETWWLNGEVQEVIKAKKESKKRWDRSGMQKIKENYTRVKKEAEMAVAREKAKALEEVCEEFRDT